MLVKVASQSLPEHTGAGATNCRELRYWFVRYEFPVGTRFRRPDIRYRRTGVILFLAVSVRRRTDLRQGADRSCRRVYFF